jgi:hypothetical protein
VLVARVDRVLEWPGWLVALVVATATSFVAEHFGGLVGVGAPLPTAYRLDGITVVVAGSLVAGAIYAVLMLRTRMARTEPVVLALLSLTMLVLGEFVQRRLGMPRLDLPTPGAHDPIGEGSLMGQRFWERDLVPTVAGGVLAVAIIVLAARPRPAAVPAARSVLRPVLGGALAGVAGAGMWFAAGFGTVARTVVHGDHTVTWSGVPVPWPYAVYGCDPVLHLTLAGSIVAGGVLYAVVVGERLPWWAPVVVGAAFLAVSAWCFADAVARIGDTTPQGGGFAPSSLLVAVELGWQVPVYGPGVLLAVPLVIVGLHRRAHASRLANTRASAFSPSTTG